MTPSATSGVVSTWPGSLIWWIQTGLRPATLAGVSPASGENRCAA
jgi:hypothetical protein